MTMIRIIFIQFLTFISVFFFGLHFAFAATPTLGNFVVTSFNCSGTYGSGLLNYECVADATTSVSGTSTTSPLFVQSDTTYGDFTQWFMWIIFFMSIPTWVYFFSLWKKRSSYDKIK